MCTVLVANLMGSPDRLLAEGRSLALLGQPLYSYLLEFGIDLCEAASWSPRTPVLQCEWGILDGRFFLRKVSFDPSVVMEAQLIQAIVNSMVGRRAKWFSGELRADDAQGEVVYRIEAGIVKGR